MPSKTDGNPESAIKIKHRCYLSVVELLHVSIKIRSTTFNSLELVTLYNHFNHYVMLFSLGKQSSL